MATLLRAYPKDVSMTIEIQLHEMETLLDYLERAIVSYDGDKEPDFKLKADMAVETIKSFNEMCESVRSFHDVS